MSSQQMGQNFCNAPFTNLETTPQGDCRICCKMPHQSILKPNGHSYKINVDGITAIWNSEWLNNFRQQFIDNKRPEECKMCWDDEEAGITSLRKQLSHDYVKNVYDPQLTTLVLKLSNKCNCACRICCFWLSSLWQKELEKTNRYPDKHIWFIGENEKNKIIPELWDDWKYNLDNISKLLIYGGEPLINEEVITILNYLVETGRCNNIYLGLNTNGTILSPDIIHLLEQFKQVNLYFSIDDIGERYNYERWPAKYKDIKKNLLEFHETYEWKNVHVCLYTSISVFNVFYLGEILEEFKEFPKFRVNFDNLIHEPYCLSLYGLPEEIKPKVEKYLDTVDFNQRWENYSDVKSIIKNFLYLYKNEYMSGDYIKQLDDLLTFDDVRRKQNWRDTFSELFKGLINE